MAWIAAAAQLPPDEEDVLLWAGGQICVGRYNYTDRVWDFIDCDEDDRTWSYYDAPIPVDYWQPLPPPPVFIVRSKKPLPMA